MNRTTTSPTFTPLAAAGDWRSTASIQAPWGISPAMLPELPLPTKIRTAFQPPVKLSRDPAKAKDDDYVERKYDEVQRSIQDGMDTLARRLAFPIFG